jgi:2,3-bisphosphoglycerate-dependent phosphoglycerate mutase
MTATNVCLIRHGETDWNVELRMQGHTDIPLNVNGLAQAEAVANALRGRRFDRLYSSDLLRALQTAEPAANVLRLPIYRSSALRERHYGAFQGMTRAEFAARHPEDCARMIQRDPEQQLPGATETLRGFAARVVSALNEIAKRHPGEAILIFTHGGVLDIAFRLAARKSIEAERDYPLLNGSLNWLQHRAKTSNTGSSNTGSWSLVRWAEQTGPQTPADARNEVEGEALSA